MKPPSKLENLSGSLPTTVSATALASVLGGPVAALLPVLTSTLANSRHKQRVEAAIAEIDSKLSSIQTITESLTDAQYKLISEVVITILHTPDDEKVEYLKKVVFEAPLVDALNMHDSTVISRALNNISVGELAFLIECYGKHILFTEHSYEGFYNIDKESRDGEMAMGLIGLGLLSRSPAEGTAGDIGAYHFTSLANKLVKLLT